MNKARTLDVDDREMCPAASLRCRLRPDQEPDATLEVGARVLLTSPARAGVPAVITHRAGPVVEVTVLAGPEPDLVVDFNTVDDTGLPWTFLDEASDPTAVTPGAVLWAGSGARTRAWVQVVDQLPTPDGAVVHVRPLPVLVVDDSLDPTPQGVPAWSATDGNTTRAAHPLSVGALVAERDMNDPPGAELPARVSWVDGDGGFGWVYRLAPVPPQR